MKSIQFSSSIYGGAGYSAVRLHQALLKHTNIESHILSKSSEVVELENGKRVDINLSFTDKLAFKLTGMTYETRFQKRIVNRPRDFDYFSPIESEYDLVKASIACQADIVNLHWAANFLDFEDFFAQIRKPVVISLCDFFMFTGGCHYPMDCTGFINTCSACPQLDMANHNLAQEHLARKKRILNKAGSDLHIVCASEWMADKSHSGIFKGYPHTILPHVSGGSYFPLDKFKCRQHLGVPLSSRIVYLGADDVRNSRKGVKLALEALQLLDNEDLFLILVGKNLDGLGEFNIPHKKINYLDSESELNILYGASDLILLPSLQDNLPLTLLDANAAGRPVLAFNEGGAKFWIKPGLNGLLVNNMDVKGFSVGIVDFFMTMASNVSEQDISQYAIQNFSSAVVAKQYEKLYASLI